jgi:hypothetical protein
MKAVAGKRYRHYKGHEYTVLVIARNEAKPEEELVIYQALYDSPDFGKNCIWARERSVFEGILTVDGRDVERFTCIDEKV